MYFGGPGFFPKSRIDMGLEPQALNLDVSGASGFSDSRYPEAASVISGFGAEASGTYSDYIETIWDN